MAKTTNAYLRKSPDRCAGFTLLEVLVAVLIFSIGILGIASLQAVSTDSSHEGVQRTTATLLAQSMVERMRQNPAALNVYLTQIAADAVGSGGVTSVDCEGVDCTTTQLAAYDVYSWDQELAGAVETRGGANVGGLVSSVGCVTGPAGGGNGRYAVTVAWKGATSVPNVSSDTCGATTFATGSDNYKYRRLVSVTTYIAGP